MLFWHLGATIAFVRYAFRDPAMDLRFLAAGAVLSDLIDLPIGIALWTSFETPRLIGHSLVLPSVAMVTILLATRRGDRRKRWMLVAVGMLLHLALDGMWRSAETLWWPFLGWEFTGSGFGTYGAYLRDLVSDPLMWLGEAAGLAYLAFLWRRSGLGGAEERSRFLATGVVSGGLD